MAKISILIFVESRYRVDRKRIRATLTNLLNKQEIGSPLEVSVAIVGDRKMRDLSKRYKGDDKARNILTFSQQEGTPIKSGGETLKLGDIVISYPRVIDEAAAEEVLVDDKIDELAIHGLSHLLGLHHE